MFVQTIKNLFSSPPNGDEQVTAATPAPAPAPAFQITPIKAGLPAFLNVGGASKQHAVPAHYGTWQHMLLDIAPGPGVDVVMDARKLCELQPAQFDAVYNSHNLEHYYLHEVPRVLAGFMHILKPDGFAEIHVPNMHGVLKRYIESGMDINGVLYVSPAGPITVHDVIYGWGKEIEQSGVDFYAHKTGFTQASLYAALHQAGFTQIWTSVTADTFGLSAIAFKQVPTAQQRALLGLPAA